MGGDNVAVKGVGTLRWTFDDNNGLSHIFLIPGLLYIPDSPARLFLPQHWAQERKDDAPVCNGTWQATFADHVLLVWGQQKYRKKIDLDKSNVATFTTSAGCKNFTIFRACLDAEGEETASKDSPGSYTAFNATLIKDDEGDNINDESEVDDPEDDETIIPVSTNQNPARDDQNNDEDGTGYSKATGHHDTSDDTYQNIPVVEDVEDDAFDGKLKPSSEVLLWHYRLGHIPLSRLQTMAKEGLLPKRLSTCRVPKCASCIYGK